MGRLSNDDKHEVNKIMIDKLGLTSYVHLPPKKGDDVYPCSWIGQDVCNLRATDTMVHILEYLHPQEWEDTASPHHTASSSSNSQTPITSSRLEQLDELHDSDDSLSEDEEGDFEKRLNEIISVGENIHGATEMNRSQLIGGAFDTAFDFVDELVNWDWDDETELGKKKQAAKLQALGNAANKALTRALTTPCYSEYNAVIEHVVPRKIREYGKLVLRANEQGQESAGVLLKQHSRLLTHRTLSRSNAQKAAEELCEQEKKD